MVGNLKQFTRAINKVVLGFTLIEVMLAMAVFSIAGVAILGVTENNTKNLTHLEMKSLASWVASNQLVELTLDKSWPPKNNKRGKAELAGHEWHWQHKVIATTDKDMRAITVEVRANEQDRDPITSLTTYLAKNGS